MNIYEEIFGKEAECSAYNGDELVCDKLSDNGRGTGDSVADTEF